MWDSMNSALFSTFGRTVTYTPKGGEPLTITGIPSDPQGEDMTPPCHKILEVRTSEVTPAEGDSVAIDGTEYYVLKLNPLPELGTVKLLLRK